MKRTILVLTFLLAVCGGVLAVRASLRRPRGGPPPAEEALAHKIMMYGRAAPGCLRQFLTDWSWGVRFGVDQAHSAAGLCVEVEPYGGLALRQADAANGLTVLPGQGYLTIRMETDRVEALTVAVYADGVEYPPKGVPLRLIRPRDAAPGAYYAVPFSQFGASGRHIRKVAIMNKSPAPVHVTLHELALAPPHEVAAVIATEGHAALD